MSVARGETPPDLLVAGGRILNVYSGELLPGAVAVAGSRIAYVGERSIKPGSSTITIDAGGLIVAPGYIDPHAHPYGMFTPLEFVRSVLPRGTTAVVADTLLWLTMTPPQTTHQLLTALGALPLQFFFFLRLHGQAHSPHDATVFDGERLEALLALESVRTVGEITRWPDVYAGEDTLLARIAQGLRRGRRVEGHAPGASADRVQVLAAAGISADHEAITADQALARLRAGLYVMLRHGSLRPDLPELAAVARGNRAFSSRLMLTPDGPTPMFIHTHGYMDHVVDVAIRQGVDPIAAHQMASVNPATYYSLDEELGGLAPGRRADILLLDDLTSPTPGTVIAGGRVVARRGRLLVDLPDLPWSEWLPSFAPTAWRPDASVFSLDGMPAPAPVIHLESTVITSLREANVAGDLPPGLLRLVLLDPAGRWRCRTLLSGFADRLGGLASTYSSMAGVYTIGRNPADMAAAASRALDLGGGIVLVEDGVVRFELPLPLGGMMSTRPISDLAAAIGALTTLLRADGYAYHDVAYSLLFLGFDSLPYVRLTYRGLWDVLRGQALWPREEL
jgi:adenine deaminase